MRLIASLPFIRGPQCFQTVAYIAGIMMLRSSLRATIRRSTMRVHLPCRPQSSLAAANNPRYMQVFEEMAKGDGQISRSDLGDAIRQALPYDDIAEEQIDRMFRVGDLDRSGSIDFCKFVTLFDVVDADGAEISVKALAEQWIGLSSSETGSDPDVIFQLAWRQVTLSHGGEEHVRLPREIMFLGGAPGAGKGTMTPIIMQERGLTNHPIVMSSLLKSPAAKKIIDEGGLVSDMEVFSILLQALAQPNHFEGCLVDGFPRTVVQVQLLQRLHSKMRCLSRSNEISFGAGEQEGASGASGGDAAAALARTARDHTYAHAGLRSSVMPRPHFRMCILYVDEHESIRRQLFRGQKAIDHNERLASGEAKGEPAEVRETDLSLKAAQTRYRLFVEDTMAANEELKNAFPFNIINASGTVDEVRQVVMQELAYQSSLELAEETYETLRHIPTAAEITKHARQNLVSRLDGYQREHPIHFRNVVGVIEREFLPHVRRHALVGEARLTMSIPYIVAQFNRKGPKEFSLGDRMRAINMAIDICFDRGFALRVEERTGMLHFKLTFKPPALTNLQAGG